MVVNATWELLGRNRKTILSADASACKGMSLRTGTGKVKHPSTKQCWVQGATPSYGVKVQCVSR